MPDLWPISHKRPALRFYQKRAGLFRLYKEFADAKTNLRAGLYSSVLEPVIIRFDVIAPVGHHGSIGHRGR